MAFEKSVFVFNVSKYRKVTEDGYKKRAFWLLLLLL